MVRLKKKKEPVSHFIHNGFTNTFGSRFQDCHHGRRCRRGRRVSVCPLRIPKPTHLSFHIKSASNPQIIN